MLTRVRSLLTLLADGFRARGAQHRIEILAYRAADLAEVRELLGDEAAERYDVVRRTTMQWALQDLGLALADLQDPPPTTT